MSFKSSLLKNHKRVYVVLTALLFGGIGSLFLVASHAATGAIFSVTPASSTVAMGTDFVVAVTEDSSTTAVNGLEADLTYDQTVLQFKSISQTNPTTQVVSPYNIPVTLTGGSGVIKIAAGASPAVTGVQPIAYVTFTAIAPGTAAVKFDTTTSGIADAATNGSVPYTTVSGSYTVTDQTAPTVPTGLTASSQTATSFNLAWTASTDNIGVTGYKIFRNGTQIGTSTTPSFSVTGLTPSTTYNMTVLANDAAGNSSAQSTPLAATTTADTTAPSVPTGLTKGTVTVTSVAMSWTASTDNVGVTGYKIFQGGTQIGTTTTTSFTATGLTPSTAYNFTVLANDAAGNSSAQSTALAASTLADTTAPSVPTGLVSTSQTNTSISLSWNASTDNVAVTGYKLFRNSVQVATPTTTSFTDTALLNGTAYTYTVAATDAAGNTSAQTAVLNVSTVALLGDANHDGHVDFHDLSILAGTWLSTTDLRADFNHDGLVDFHDLSALASNWGK